MKESRIIMGFVAVALVIFAACGEDEEAPPATEAPGTATTSATQRAMRTSAPQLTEAPESGGLEGFRSFATQIDDAIQAGDADFFVERADTASLTCPNEFEPRCADQLDGTTIEGIPLGIWASDGGSLLPPDDFRAALGDYLSSVPDVSLFAIAEQAGSAQGDGPSFYAIASGTSNPAEATRIFQYAFRDGSWRLKGAIEARVLAEQDWLSGECSCYDSWERWEGS